MRGKWPLIGGLVVLVAVVAGVISLIRTPPPPKQASPAVAAKPAAPPDLSLQGVVQAKTVVNIPAPVDGTVDRFLADVGDDVYDGELLAHIKNPKLESDMQSLQGEVTRAQAQITELEGAVLAARLEASRTDADAAHTKSEVDRAEKNYLRQKALAEDGATPRLTFEKAELDFNNAKTDADNLAKAAAAAADRVITLTAGLEKARQTAKDKLQNFDEAIAGMGAGEVHSSADGIVLARRVKQGETVTRDIKDLFQIGVDLKTLQVALTPDAKQLAQIHAGQTALVQIPGAPGPISSSVREVTGVQALLEFTNPSPPIKPGALAQVRIVLSTTK